ncbi:MAG: hypothetical protein QW590_03550 [Candidatus Bilamarchaeaceae archaeon]
MANIRMSNILKVPVIYIKDKQAFEKYAGTLRLLGSAPEIARELSKKYRLLHVVDLDLKGGSLANFDIYDKLTYFIHIQVECSNESAARRLLQLNARIVVELPTKLPLEEWNKRLLVGIVSGDEDAALVHDVIIRNPSKEKIDKYRSQGKRIMLYENEWDQKEDIWAVILSKP